MLTAKAQRTQRTPLIITAYIEKESLERETMKGDQCEFCEEEMKQRRVLARFRFNGQTIYVENVPAWVCNKCGEQYFDAPVYKRLEEIARQRERIQTVISFPLAKFNMAIA